MFNKSRIFTLAHSIKNNFANFSEALKTAWMIVKAKLGIATTFVFAKSSGELRVAVAVGIGCLESTIERGFVKFVERLEDGGEQWRSFRFERLIFER